MLPLATPTRRTGRPAGRPLPKDSFVWWQPQPELGAVQPPVLPAGDITGKPIRLVLQHVLRHSVFAEYDCDHCSRSYGRAMARYHH